MCGIEHLADSHAASAARLSEEVTSSQQPLSSHARIVGHCVIGRIVGDTPCAMVEAATILGEHCNGQVSCQLSRWTCNSYLHVQRAR
ncbi:hypothetical protein D3C80_1521500 [compost metagenome]